MIELSKKVRFRKSGKNKFSPLPGAELCDTGSIWNEKSELQVLYHSYLIFVNISKKECYIYYE